MHKKITKMRLMRYRIMKKNRFLGIFRLGKPRVPKPGIDSLRNFTSIIYFWKIFFYRSKPFVAKNAKKSFCSKKMAMKSKTGVETPKKFFLSWNFGHLLFFGEQIPAKIWAKSVTYSSPTWKSYMESPQSNWYKSTIF